MRKSNEEMRSDAQRALSVGMKRLVTGFRSLLEAALEEKGLTLAQLRMLHALSERADVSAAELARICFITPQSMQAIVTRAEREGWITRSASPANRRVLRATLTKAGRRALERGKALSAGLEQTVWADASLVELTATNHMLAKALVRLQGSLDRHHEDAATKRKTA